MRPHRLKMKLPFALCALVGGALGLFASLLTGNTLLFFTSGAIPLTFGVLALTVPTVIVTEDEVQLRNLYGMTMKRIPYRRDEISFDGLRMMAGGVKVKGMSAWGLRRDHLEALRRDLGCAPPPEARLVSSARAG